MYGDETVFLGSLANSDMAHQSMNPTLKTHAVLTLAEAASQLHLY